MCKQALHIFKFESTNKIISMDCLKNNNNVVLIILQKKQMDLTQNINSKVITVNKNNNYVFMNTIMQNHV